MTQSLPKVNSVDQMASNFEIFETRRIGIEFEDEV